MTNPPKSPRKFTFETSFGEATARTAAAAAATRKRFYTPEEAEVLQAEAFEAGRRSTEAMAANAASLALGEIARAVLAAMQELEALGAEARREANAAALAAAGKISGAALARFPLAYAEEAVAATLAQVPLEPRVSVHVAPALVAPLKERIDAVAAEIGYAGRIVITGDPSAHGARCRLEWSRGGLERDPAALAARLEAALARFAETDVSETEAHAKEQA